MDMTLNKFLCLVDQIQHMLRTEVNFSSDLLLQCTDQMAHAGKWRGSSWSECSEQSYL